MAFPNQEVRTPTSIGTIWHILKDTVGGPDTVRYVFQVLDQNGVVMRTECGDELPHIGAPHGSNLVSFVAAQRAKADGTLPEAAAMAAAAVVESPSSMKPAEPVEMVEPAETVEPGLVGKLKAWWKEANKPIS